jgi:hypothetical protein
MTIGRITRSFIGHVQKSWPLDCSVHLHRRSIVIRPFSIKMVLNTAQVKFSLLVRKSNSGSAKFTCLFPSKSPESFNPDDQLWCTALDLCCCKKVILSLLSLGNKTLLS